MIFKTEGPVAVQVGDTVRLKSGGPEMKVTAIEKRPDGNFKCEWLNDEGVVDHGLFPVESLILVIPVMLNAVAGSGSEADANRQRMLDEITGKRGFR
jgi:uncharacterized protein YodC (DUF2158 family)